MANGMWPSVSGASARTQAVDIVSNNLANADSLGFKKDLPTFREYLAVEERIDDGPSSAHHGPIKDRDLYPLDGKDQAFVVVSGTHTDYSQGRLRVTQRPLDVALDGPGFFEVGTPNGVRYTKQGSFKLSMDGRLVTSEGYPVLTSTPGGLASAPPASAVQPGQGGLTTQGGVAVEQIKQEIEARSIDLRDVPQGALSITETGEIFAGDRKIARLAVTEFQDNNKLKKQGESLFRAAEGATFSQAPSKTRVMQGMIETSNVNPIEEMTNLIKANRMFEHDLKSLKTYNEMMGKEANDIGKL